MPEEVAIVQPSQEQVVQVEEQVGNGFWGSSQPQVTTPVVTATEPPADPPKPSAPPTAPVFDEPAYLKEKFGVENVDAIKTQLSELSTLREKAQTPAEIKFANEQSKQFFDLVQGGKKKELMEHLVREHELEQAETGEIADAKSALSTLNLFYKYKYKDFSQDEITDHIRETYEKPVKPEFELGDDEEKYKLELKSWEDKCASIDKRMIRDAKMIKPDLLQFKSQIVLPTIEKTATTSKQPTQEELEAAKKEVTDFLSSADNELKSFNGIDVTFKDEAVEITSAYNLTQDEKNTIQEQMKVLAANNFDVNFIFSKLWVKEDNTFDVARMLRDLARLNAGDKLDQKFAQDAAGQRLKKYKEEKKNIHLDGITTPHQNGSVDKQKALEEVEAAVWNNVR